MSDINKQERDFGPDASPVLEADSGTPVVGLGGSAGALASFESFFKAMPPDSGAAFVVIQHMSPDHASLLPEILAQHTQMRVHAARDGMFLEPNSVYIIPPNSYLNLRARVLSLTEPPSEDRIRMPIDNFFRSLAENCRERAVCIIFSGADSDGTYGARAVRNGGGTVIAQDPQTAQFPEMPARILETGLVDYVLPPHQMPELLLQCFRHIKNQRLESLARRDTESILAQILAQTGSDFRYYKRSTVSRRIKRRMALRNVSEMHEYSGQLHQDSNEIKALRNDLLIKVTGFFRDTDAFQELRDRVIVPLVQAKLNEKPLRIWVPGCSTGEEAYSLAMLIAEQLEENGKQGSLQVFATDIDEEALQVGRVGIYPENIAADMDAELLRKFFVKREDNTYQVNETLRKALIFATHNLIYNPPFAQLDLISCRNLLIYMDSEAQQKLMLLFNFALRADGYLFLGKSEAVAGQKNLFEIISRKSKIYRRLSPARPFIPSIPFLPEKKRTAAITTPASARAGSNFADVLRVEILKHFEASALLVDTKGQVLQFHGQTGKYLRMPTSGPPFNVLELAQERLTSQLRVAMHKAIHDGQKAILDDISIEREGDTAFARITVIPVSQRAQSEPALVIFFEDTQRPASPELVRRPEEESLVNHLQEELRTTQEDLQSVITDFKSSEENLRIANEEVVLAREELQSANEEYLTSTEELQATNEELNTVINQLQEKIGLLDKANNDIENLLKSSDIAALFLDKELRINFFTPAISRILNMIQSDLNRPITHLKMNFMGYDLTADAQAVVRESAVIEREVRHADGAHFLMRAMPYCRPDSSVDGVVITFSDITRVHHAEELLIRIEERFRVLVESSPNALVVAAMDGKITLLNRQAEVMFGYTREELMGQTIEILVPERFRGRHPSYRKDFSAAPQQRPMGAGRDLFAARKDGSEVPVEIGLTPIVMPEGPVTLATITDITKRKRLDLRGRKKTDKLS
jgi:two-component system, chemotaxis family, CheB/CheR fusion protein